MEAMFNPSEFRISRSISWNTIGGEAVGKKTIIEQQFETVSPASVSIELFFDSYEVRGGGFLASLNPFPEPEATDVRKYTKKLAELSKVKKELHRPPICKLAWGEFDDLFCGVLTNLTQNFTMFMPNGMPVRATVTCDFIEYEIIGTEVHSPDVTKTHIVSRHETLHSIAGQMYNDPSKWRTIAQANGIINPRLLTPGMSLVIPKLR